MMNKEIFRVEMARRSLSLRKLEELTGIKHATIHRIYHGKREPTVDEARKIAAKLEVSVEDLWPIN